MDSPFDFISILVDEIALEGLDGITLQMLWWRLKERPNFLISIDQDSKNFIWGKIAKHKDIDIYELPKPRKFVPPFNRYGNLDSELGIVLEHDGKIYDPYIPIVLIKDGNVRGSCATYEKRNCITTDIRCGDDVLLMSLAQVESRWGDGLVLVASPSVRLRALIGTETNPLIELSLEAYALLERIGRARRHGEVTQGEGGLLSLKAPFCKQIHYYRKKLSDRGLITKQMFYQKSVKGGTTNGCLFHLTRFHMLHKTKLVLLMKQICDVLHDKPHQRESCKAIREELNIREGTFKKLFNRGFQKWVKTEMMPIHEFNPKASQKECFTLAGQEKVIKVVELLRHCDEGDDEEVDDNNRVSSMNVHFDCSRILTGQPLIMQVAALVEQAGPEGISSGDLGRILTLPRLDIRNFLKNLIRMKQVITVLQDRGRQKVTKYIDVNHAHRNETYTSLQEQEAVTSESHPKRKSEEKEDEVQRSLPPKKKSRFHQENDFQDIVSHVLELHNEHVFTGKSPKLVSLSDKAAASSGYGSGGINATQLFTLRKLKRSNLISDFLRKEKISLLPEIQKYIMDVEKDEGYNFKLDKKSTARLVYRLHGVGKLKIFKAVLQLDNKQAEIEFICDNTLEASDPRIQVAIEQAKFKYFGVNKEEKSFPLTKSTPTDKVPAVPVNTKVSSRQFPKFQRAKALHSFLFYLTYENKSGNETTKDNSAALSWKSFVPPLPEYGYKKRGWCFLADIFPRMPLSVFLHLCSSTVRVSVPGLEMYLDHEEKRHTLIKFLPQAVRNSLLNDRKYLFSTGDVLKTLFYMGLVSMGPMVGKQKDQVFLYIHQHATVKDTTVSSPGYIYIQSDLEYETKHYLFQTVEDISNYWLELESICFHTPLGKFSTAAGKTISITEAAYKPALASTLCNKRFEDVVDNGFMPGDGLGAGGFDSVLFMHTRRNWHPSTHMQPSTTLRSMQNILQSDPADVKARLQRLVKNAVQLEMESKLKNSRNTAPPSKSIESKTKTRTVKLREAKKKRLPFYDEKDKMAMEKMDKARCDWTPQEDSFLLLCKVVSCFLDPLYTKNLAVPYTVVRDLLYKHVPGVSADKSSRACQRRVRYMMLNPTTTSNVSVFLGEALQDMNLVSRFDGPKPPKSNEAAWKEMFTQALEYLREKFTLPAADRGQCQYIPESVEEFQRKYHILNECELFSSKTIFRSPENENDIQKFVLSSLILSALAIATSGDQWPYLLHKLYQGYSESILQTVVTHLRRNKVIAVKKKSHRSDLQRSLRSTCPYKFSITYNNAFITKFPSKVFHESRELLQCLKSLEHETALELKGDVPSGYAAVVLALVTSGELTLQTVVPDQVILFDSAHSKEIERMIHTLSDAESQELTQQLLSRETRNEPSEVVTVDDLTTTTITSTDGQRFQNASRFALYLLRQEMSQPPIERVQHSQDYIILNSCRIFCRLSEASVKVLEIESPQQKSVQKELREGTVVQNSEPEAMDVDDTVQHQRELSSSEMMDIRAVVSESVQAVSENNSHQLPIIPGVTESEAIVEKSVQEPNSEVSSLQTEASLPGVVNVETLAKSSFELTEEVVSQIYSSVISFVSEDSFKSNQKQDELLCEIYLNVGNSKTLEDGKHLYHYIYEAGTKGVEEMDILRTFSVLKGDLSCLEHLVLMQKGQVVLRVGITAFTYVCYCFSKPWLLQSYKIDTNANSGTQPTEGGTTSAARWSNRVFFLPRTWRHPDGSLNRKVFFDLLTTVLSHVTSVPGTTSAEVCDHFATALPNIHTLELIDVLEKIGCIQRYYCKPVKKMSLFSSASVYTLSEQRDSPNDIDHLETQPESVCLVAKLQAMLP